MRPAQLKKFFRNASYYIYMYYINDYILVCIIYMHCVSKTAVVNLSWGTSGTSRCSPSTASWLMVTCCCGYGSKPNATQTVPVYGTRLVIAGEWMFIPPNYLAILWVLAHQYHPNLLAIFNDLWKSEAPAPQKALRAPWLGCVFFFPAAVGNWNWRVQSENEVIPPPQH
jgi:hypothetical protein